MGEAEGPELLDEGNRESLEVEVQKGWRRDLVLVEEGLLPEMAQISSADREFCAPAWREEGSPGFAELPQSSQARLREPNS